MSFQFRVVSLRVAEVLRSGRDLMARGPNLQQAERRMAPITWVEVNHSPWPSTPPGSFESGTVLTCCTVPNLKFCLLGRWLEPKILLFIIVALWNFGIQELFGARDERHVAANVMRAKNRLCGPMTYLYTVLPTKVPAWTEANASMPQLARRVVDE